MRQKFSWATSSPQARIDAITRKNELAYNTTRAVFADTDGRGDRLLTAFLLSCVAHTEGAVLRNSAHRLLRPRYAATILLTSALPAAKSAANRPPRSVHICVACC